MLAVFALTRGVAVLAGDRSQASVQPRQTVAPAAGTRGQEAPASQPGQQAAEQPAAPTPAPPSGTTYHVVQMNETLGKIAAQYGVTTAALVRANNITNPNLIRIGQRLVIPPR